MPVWHGTYLQAKGLTLFHPGTINPVGFWWAADDTFAFSVHSPSEFDGYKLAAASWAGHDNVIPPECELNLYTDRPVPPGGSATVTAVIRVSVDRSLPHLIAPYKAEYDRHFPLPMFTPDDRLVGQFSSVGDNLITPRNPLGYNGDWRRLDTATGTAAYVGRVVPQLKRANAVGMIFWSPGGYQPPMYPPDFDVLPPQVQRNIPALVKGFREQGLRVGFCARPGDGVDRPPGQPPSIYRLSADNPDHMKATLGRFRHAMDMGFDMFYLDSFGGYGLNDLRILKRIRATVGPDVLLYPEYCTDVSLPYAGRFCQLQKDGTIRWDGWDIYRAMRLLAPRSTWLCFSETTTPVPKPFAARGLTPIVGDYDLHRIAPWTPTPFADHP